MKAVIAIVISVLLSCKSNKRQYQTIVILESKDSCYQLLDSFNKSIEAGRMLEIVENTFTDTVGLGYAVLLPGYTGPFRYVRGAYLEGISEEEWPSTNELCINRYQYREVKGKLVIRYYEKPNTK